MSDLTIDIARTALVFAEDAMSGMRAEAHGFSCENVFRTMGKVRSTRELIAALQAGAGDA